MESAHSSPLLDFFRRGEAPRDVRLLAAQAGFAPRPLEQLALLAMLAADADPEIRATAEQTLSRISHDEAAGVLARTEAPAELREFFAARGITAATAPAPAVGGVPLVDGDDTDYGPEETSEAERVSLYSRLAAMSVPERVKAAMKGTREMRAVLVRDPNKLVALSVLSSPKLTETEVEAYARMGSVAEDVLRTIARTRAWIKNYAVVVALVRNAKTPLAVSLNLLSRLNEGDLKRLSTDRNVPDTLRISARKRVVIG
jgi:hypothetical protein